MGKIYNPPQYGKEFTFFVSLVSQADANLMKANPTIVTADVQIDKDGANSFTDLDTIPTVVGTSVSVKVTVSATEMKADNVTIIFSDAAGDEWADLTLNIQPSKAASAMTHGTVDTTVAATTTTFECDDITEATGEHFIGKNWHWIPSLVGSDALVGSGTRILDYSLESGKGRFTVEQMTDIPADNDEGIIL